MDSTPLDACRVSEPELVARAGERISKILDAKHKPADLKKAHLAQLQLKFDQQQKLLASLEK